MKNTKISLEFLNSGEPIELNKGVSFVNNQILIEFLKQEKYKNECSNFTVKESSEINVSDLLKIKINIESVGYFLVNLKNTEENRNKRLEILEKVKELKTDNVFNLEKQYLKIKSVIEILNGYNLLFALFTLEDPIPNEYINFNGYVFNFPLLFINENRTKKTKPVKAIKSKKNLINIDAPFFDLDYFFNLLFALFASFSLHTAVSLFCDDNWKGTLFIILFIAILCVSNYCLYLIYYEKNSKQISGHKFIMGLYLALGSALGLIISILISQYYLEIKYNGLLIFIDILAFIVSVCAIFESKIITLFKKR